MELHSYARSSKPRSGSQWTIEHKRQLVEARIKNDELFFKRPSSCIDTWRKIVSVAELQDFDVFLARKQWTNMLIEYKKFKQGHLGNNVSSNAIDEETVKKISQEWEFFYPIHNFMSRKVTNLHSYAQSHNQKRINQHDLLAAELDSMLETNSSPDCDQLVEEEGTVNIIDEINDYNISHNVRTEDHKNSLSKKIEIETNKRPASPKFLSETEKTKIPKISSAQNNTKNKSFEEDIPSTSKGTRENMVDIEKSTSDTKAHKMPQEENNQRMNIEKTKSTLKVNREKRNKKVDDTLRKVKKHTMRNATSPISVEREKYYRHKRRFNRRLEHRLDSLLGVFGQIIKAEYPNVDVSGLIHEYKSETEDLAASRESIESRTRLGETSNYSSNDE